MEKCLGNKLTSIIHQNIKKWTLKSSLTFCNYSSSQLEIIASEFKNKSYKAD